MFRPALNRLPQLEWAAMLGVLVYGVLSPAMDLRAEPPKPVANVEGISEYQLDNGLRVLLFPDASQPTVTVSLTVFVGSRHEGAGEGGMAHLLEHMVFKGTPTHADIPKLLRDRGASFNGTTSLDRTNYFETLPASEENLEFAIHLEADRMVNSYIKGEDLASEMTVVRNEFERSENDPIRVLMQKIQSAAYEWHNYGKPTIGNRTDIERVPLPKLREFYRKYYQPDNAMLVIAGKFDDAKALEFAQKYFGSIPRPERVLPKTYTEEPPQDGERRVMLRRVGDVSVVASAYHIPSGAHPDYPAVSILADILANRPSGRLYKELVESKLAAAAFAFARAQHDPSLLMALSMVPEADKLDSARNKMIDVIEGVAKGDVTQEEVDRARQRILKNRDEAAADSSRLAVALSDWAAQGDWRLYFIYRDRIESVTPEDVQRVAAEYLVPHNRTLGVYIPTSEPSRATIPARPDITELVEQYQGRDEITAGEQFDPTPDNIEMRTQRGALKSGLKTALLPKKTRGNVVYLRVTLRYGEAKSLRGQVAAAEFLPNLMTRGTRSLTYQQLQDALDKNFASLSGSGSPGYASFNVQTKRQYLPTVIDLLRQVIREPALPETEFEVVRRQSVTGLEQLRSDPQALASLAMQRAVNPYPEGDVRYIPTIEEELDRAKSITVEQIRDLYTSFLGASHGEVTLVGDFDPDEVLPLLEDAFEGWVPERPYARIKRRAFVDVKGSAEQILTPDKANAAYFSGMSLAVRDTHPDYPALVIGNFILGGGSLSSRLGDRVRQQEGLSYTVRSAFSASSQDDAGQFLMYAISNPENVSRVVEVIREELVKLLESGVSEEELQEAQQAYLEGRRLARSRNAALVGLLASSAYLDRTMAFEQKLDEKIARLTPDQVLAAFRKHIDPDRLVVVTAGDFAAEPKEAEDKDGQD